MAADTYSRPLSRHPSLPESDTEVAVASATEGLKGRLRVAWHVLAAVAVVELLAAGWIIGMAQRVGG